MARMQLEGELRYYRIFVFIIFWKSFFMVLLLFLQWPVFYLILYFYEKLYNKNSAWSWGSCAWILGSLLNEVKKNYLLPACEDLNIVKIVLTASSSHSVSSGDLKVRQFKGTASKDLNDNKKGMLSSPLITAHDMWSILLYHTYHTYNTYQHTCIYIYNLTFIVPENFALLSVP